MRTRDQVDEITHLPPPPAPTARDANPWPVAGAPEAPRRVPSVRVARRRRDPGTRKLRDGMRNLVVLGIVAFIIVSAALEAVRGGGPGALVGVVFPLLIVGILFLARRQKSQQRDRRGSTGPGGGN